MKKRYCLLVAFTMLILTVSCKKTEESLPEENAIINTPSSSEDFYVVNLYNPGAAKFEVRWTNDFEHFKLFNSSIESTSAVFSSGDTLLILSANGKKVYYGSVYHPDKMKKVTSNRIISDLAMINGVLVALSVDVNNYYRGYCDVKNGETSFNFILLPGGTLYRYLSYVNHAVISSVSISGSNVLGYTRNGKHWTITSAPPISSNIFYSYENNKTIARDSWDAYVTSDTNYTSATWQSVNYNVNTTDTIGTFTSYSKKIPGKWVYYGMLASNVTGNEYPAVNISNDDGQTFTTTLLEGIPDMPNDNLIILGFDDLTLISFHIGGGVFKAYTSSDGINFTEGTYSSFKSSALRTGAYFQSH